MADWITYFDYFEIINPLFERLEKLRKQYGDKTIKLIWKCSECGNAGEAIKKISNLESIVESGCPQCGSKTGFTGEIIKDENMTEKIKVMANTLLEDVDDDLDALQAKWISSGLGKLEIACNKAVDLLDNLPSGYSKSGKADIIYTCIRDALGMKLNQE